MKIQELMIILPFDNGIGCDEDAGADDQPDDVAGSSNYAIKTDHIGHQLAIFPNLLTSLKVNYQCINRIAYRKERGGADVRQKNAKYKMKLTCLPFILFALIYYLHK